jgi:uncharacterized protein (TIGR02246 family)
VNTQQEQIKQAYDRFAANWKTNDGAAVATDFVEDGSLINPFGQAARGRPALAAMYAEYFAGMLRGTTTTCKIAEIRVVEGNHAFVDAEQTIHGPDGGVVLVVHLAALLRHERDGWRFVDSRPYTFASRPS